MTRFKQDRSRRSGHAHSKNTQDEYEVKQHPPAYHSASAAQRQAWRRAMAARHLAKMCGDEHPLIRQARRNLIQAAVALEVESGIGDTE